MSAASRLVAAYLPNDLTRATAQQLERAYTAICGALLILDQDHPEWEAVNSLYEFVAGCYANPPIFTKE
jgi:hypothetical protein